MKVDVDKIVEEIESYSSDITITISSEAEITNKLTRLTSPQLLAQLSSLEVKIKDSIVEDIQNKLEKIRADIRSYKSKINDYLLTIISFQYPKLDRSKITENLEKIISSEPSFFTSVIDAKKIHQITNTVATMSDPNRMQTLVSMATAACVFWRQIHDTVNPKEVQSKQPNATTVPVYAPACSPR